MNEIQVVEKKIDNIEFTLEGIEGNVKSIKELLTGNPLNSSDRGMIGEALKTNENLNRLAASTSESLSKLASRVERLETFNKKIIWIGIGLALGAGYSLDKIIELFKH